MDVHARAPASRQSGSAGCDGKWLRPGGLGRLQNQSTPQNASDLVLPFSSPLKVEMSFLNKSARGARSRKNGIRSGEFRRMFGTHFPACTHLIQPDQPCLRQAGKGVVGKQFHYAPGVRHTTWRVSIFPSAFATAISRWQRFASFCKLCPGRVYWLYALSFLSFSHISFVWPHLTLACSRGCCTGQMAGGTGIPRKKDMSQACSSGCRWEIRVP